MKMRSEVIDRIVVRLIGIYGQQFHGKYSRIESGVDVGIAMFKDALATELANFADNLDAIKYALDNLPATHCPNALEFRDIARRAPRKEAPTLPYKPTAEDVERNKEMAHKANQAVKANEFDGLLWAKKPKSQKAMDMIADAKKYARRFPALAKIFDQHVSEGVANEAGKLLYRWDGLAWVKA